MSFPSSCPRQILAIALVSMLFLSYIGVFFFFQAEDGIRDYKVTGVQTCALPIFQRLLPVEDQPDRLRFAGHCKYPGWLQSMLYLIQSWLYLSKQCLVIYVLLSISDRKSVV